MQSTAPDVDAYGAEVPERRREALSNLRELCRAETAFASQKQSIPSSCRAAIVRAAFDQRLHGYDMGEGCLRVCRPETIDYDLVRDLLQATAARPNMIF